MEIKIHIIFNANQETKEVTAQLIKDIREKDNPKQNSLFPTNSYN